MATKQEIINGVEFLIGETRRIATVLREDEWSRAKDSDGWQNAQVLAHVASIGSIVVPYMQQMSNAAPDANAGAGLDINALNAGLVAARAGKSVGELADETAANYGGVIDFVKTTDDAFWLDLGATFELRRGALAELFDEDMLGDDLEAWLNESFLLKRTFRNCAVIAGLID